MTDILVRVPKREIEHFWEPIGPDRVAWWTLSRAPKDCGVGDTIWFQIEDEVVASAKVTFVDTEERECDSTGRAWNGVHLGWEGGTLKKLDKARKGEKLTRGFMYYNTDK